MRIDVKAPKAAKDRAAVRSDTIFQTIAAMTPEQVDSYFDSQLSALSGMDPAQIDAYIEANINTLAQAKDALKVLAKDSAFISNVVQIIAKALVVLARQI